MMKGFPHILRYTTRYGLVLAAALTLSACESLALPDWLGGADQKKPLPGERIAVLRQATAIAPDSNAASLPFALPPLTENILGGEDRTGGNLLFGGAWRTLDDASVGEGNASDSRLLPAPVVIPGRVFGMDGKGYISAHDTTRSLATLWESGALVGEEAPEMLGGGLAYSEGRLIATSGFGVIAALDAQTGALLWKHALGAPVRGAPRVAAGRVYVMTVDNQLFALNATNGNVLWNHRGVSETASFLTAVSPAVGEGIVIAPHTTGELVALKADNGEEGWSDALVVAKRTQAAAVFNGIDANPVIQDGVVYAISSGGLLAANQLVSGRRVWEQPIAGTATPWLAGEYLYLISSEYQLIAVHVPDGRIKWVSALEQFGNPEKQRDRRTWHGPVMVGGQLLVVGAHGVAELYSPETGAKQATHEIPDGITAPPVVAGGRLYVLSANARLHVVE